MEMNGVGCVCILGFYNRGWLHSTSALAFKTYRLGVWLFMSEMPYGTLSSNMLWKLFSIMHCAESENLEKLSATMELADCRRKLKGRAICKGREFHPVYADVFRVGVGPSGLGPAGRWRWQSEDSTVCTG